MPSVGALTVSVVAETKQLRTDLDKAVARLKQFERETRTTSASVSSAFGKIGVGGETLKRSFGQVATGILLMTDATGKASETGKILEQSFGAFLVGGPIGAGIAALSGAFRLLASDTEATARATAEAVAQYEKMVEVERKRTDILVEREGKRLLEDDAATLGISTEMLARLREIQKAKQELAEAQGRAGAYISATELNDRRFGSGSSLGEDRKAGFRADIEIISELEKRLVLLEEEQDRAEALLRSTRERVKAEREANDELAKSMEMSEKFMKAEDKFLKDQRDATEQRKRDALRAGAPRVGGTLENFAIQPEDTRAREITAQFERDIARLRRESAGMSAEEARLLGQIEETEAAIAAIKALGSKGDKDDLAALLAKKEGTERLLAALRAYNEERERDKAREKASNANASIDSEIAMLRAVTDEQRTQAELAEKVKRLRAEGASEEKIAALATATAWRQSFDAAQAARQAATAEWQSFVTTIGSTVSGALTDGIVDGLTNGFKNGEDILKNFVNQMLRVVVSSLASQAVTGLLGGLFGGGGGGGIASIATSLVGGIGGGGGGGGGVLSLPDT